MAGAARLYHVICGTTTAYRAPELIRAVQPLADEVLTLLTPGAVRVISPRMLMLEPGHQLIESYFDAAILPRPIDGAVLVAPCSFNTLNKLAVGIADSLALSITADLIGRGAPVVVAVSTNAPLWAHPRAQASTATLREWGVTVVDPVLEGEERTMAPVDQIVSVLAEAIATKT